VVQPAEATALNTVDTGSNPVAGTSRGATPRSRPASAIGKDIDGAANVITAAICQLTKNQPAGVCTSAGVMTASRSV
jgi:hypothetical protein